MKSGAGTKQSNNTVVSDRQWIRRVQQEEINMIDSFHGNRLANINKAREQQQKNHFYPQHTRMSNTSKAAAQAYGAGSTASNAREENKSFVSKASSKASRARDSDGLDSVSQVSVTTPKSFGRSNSHIGDSVSYASLQTKTTTVSTKQKLQDLENELHQERELRI